MIANTYIRVERNTQSTDAWTVIHHNLRASLRETSGAATIVGPSGDIITYDAILRTQEEIKNNDRVYDRFTGKIYTVDSSVELRGQGNHFKAMLLRGKR